MMYLIPIFMLLARSQGAEEINKSWFSMYGKPNFARVSSEGTDQGEMTKFDCSRSCAGDSVCKSFQYKVTSQNSGTCMVFDNYTFRKDMIASPGTKYYEKRKCALDLPIDAAALHRTDYHTSMFSRRYVRVYKFNVESNVITSVNRAGHYLISDMFPGHTATVDAAFEMPGMSPARTILLQGTQEFCYDRSSSVLSRTFTKCADTHYLSTFFSATGLDHVDTIAVYDLTNRDVHVTVNGTVYHLRYSDMSGKFQLVTSFGQFQMIPGNPWYNMFSGLTAIFRLTSRSYYVFQGSKYTRYDTMTKQITSSPYIVCDD